MALPHAFLVGLPALDGFVSVRDRTVVSLLLLGGLLALAWGASRLGDVLADHVEFDTRLVDVAMSVTLLAYLVVAGTLLVRLWDAGPSVRQAVDQFGEPSVLAVRALITLTILAAVYVLTGIVRGTIDEVMERRSRISQHQTEILYRVVQVCVYGFALLVALGVWRVNLSGLLIGAGFLGIVVGMAARQTLGALIAGFVLMFSRPFEIGDWVQIGDKEGIVTDITVVNTRLQTFDGEYVMLPNDLVSSNEVVNRSRKGRLRIEVDVGVDYATDVEEAMEVANETMKDVEETLSVPQPQVVLREFGDSSVVLRLRFWIDKPSARRKWRAQTAVIREVKAAFDEAGVKIPFPQRELTGRAETGGFRVAGPQSEVAANGPGAGDGEVAESEAEAEAETEDGDD
ncbi:MAG: mechanosensitive ion channel family protein [Halobacteriaceae archaeon]